MLVQRWLARVVAVRPEEVRALLWSFAYFFCLLAAYYILRDQRPYEELGGDYFIQREDQERLTRRLVHQLERLGQRVTLEPVAAETR